MAQAVVGIIGGSGVYELPGAANIRRERVETPWGEPSDELVFGEIGGDPGRSFCRAMDAAIGSRPRRSTTAPISTR